MFAYGSSNSTAAHYKSLSPLELSVFRMNIALRQFRDALESGGVSPARAEEIAAQAGWDGNNELHRAARRQSTTQGT